MKYYSWKNVPIKGRLKVMYNDNACNYVINQVYEYDLTNIKYYNDMYPDSIGRPEYALNITPNYPEGNFLHISQVEFIEKEIKEISKEFEKMFKQL